MNRQRKRSIPKSGPLALAALVASSLLISSCGADGPDRAVTSVPAASVTVPRASPNVATPSVAAGDAQAMVAQHHVMMDQMRTSATPQMLQLMNADPMWQMMRSGEFIELLEKHEGDIDQMLGRAGG